MIVVTGGSGFLGSWIVRALHKENTPLTVLVRPNSDCWRLNDLENLRIVRSASEDWPEVISRLRPRVVVACDWEGVDGASRGDSNMQFANVRRLSALAEAAKNSGVGVFIGFGSQAELGPHSHAITENEKDNPVSAYAEAKVQLRRKLLSLFEGSDVRFVWARVFSIYGPLDTGSGMLPSLIRTLQADEIFNATKGDQTWSYLYASDFASATLRIIESSEIMDVVNIGNPEGVLIKDVIRLVAQCMNRPKLINFGELEIDSKQSQYLVPITTQLTRSMWRPVVTLNDGIRRTIDWFADAQIPVGVQKLPSKPEE